MNVLGVSRSSVSIVRRVTSDISLCLRESISSFLSQKWMLKKGVYSAFNFSLCVGAIHGTHTENKQTKLNSTD